MAIDYIIGSWEFIMNKNGVIAAILAWYRDIIPLFQILVIVTSFIQDKLFLLLFYILQLRHQNQNRFQMSVMEED